MGRGSGEEAKEEDKKEANSFQGKSYMCPGKLFISSQSAVKAVGVEGQDPEITGSGIWTRHVKTGVRVKEGRK